MGQWQIRDAKARLSALINAARQAPQIITRRGDPVAVVLSYSQYQALRAGERRPSLFDFFRTWPELDIPARGATDCGRDVDI